MQRASDSLKYIKTKTIDDLYDEHYKYPEYGQDKYYDYLYFDERPYPSKRLQEKLQGQRFDCPNCAKRTVKVSIDQVTDTYFIRVHCHSCLAYVFMQVTSFALKSANFNLMSHIVKDAIRSLKNTSEVDLDAMIDKDWELAGG